jgi:hypothetical protein
MKNAFLSALVASLLFCGCGAHRRVQNHIPANAGVYEDAEGYAVLSMLLSGANEETRGGILRINMLSHVESVNGTHSLEDCMKIPEEFRQAADDYERRAATALVFRRKFTMKTPYDLAGETRIVGTKAKPPSASPDTAARISSGVFYLSPVGFDANRTHAIAYENYICGNLCGWGGFHLLVKNAGKWEEAKGVSACTWHY